jgi:hypothetical protein
MKDELGADFCSFDPPTVGYREVFPNPFFFLQNLKPCKMDACPVRVARQSKMHTYEIHAL